MKTETPTRWWDLPTAVLLMGAMLTAATRLVVTDWTVNLNLVQTLVFFGVIAGLLLGQSRFSPRLAFLFGLAYGLFAVPFELGSTLGTGIEWSERLQSLAGRLNIIFRQLANHEVVQDSLLFIVLMAILFWVLSVYAGYNMTRYGHAWRAVLPAGLTLFVIHSFDAVMSERAWYLAVYLFFALVLVARAAYLHQHERWQQSRTALPPHLGLDFIRFTLLAAAVIVIFSWTVPALASTLPTAERVFQRIRQPWNEARDRFDNAFASLRSNVGVVSDYYGSSLMLGRGNRLTDSQVFDVKVDEKAPAGIRYYWHARTYDTYRNGQWFSSGGQANSFNPQTDTFVLPDETGRWAGIFEFLAATPVTSVFMPSEPHWVSRPGLADETLLPDGSHDLSTFRAQPSISAGEVYQVQASISTATVAEMKASGSNYPEWIKERYLQLPENITPRTRKLAGEITAGMNNPYDKAAAITNWLRRNITYSETVPNQPAGQETVDWFLFDLRQGFCNYYSTAEVVMLRSLGIPARWSVGYAQGEKLDDGSYLIRQRDAHAWPEVYFAGLGWIEFEPTASQPAIFRPLGDTQTANGSNSGTTPGEEDLKRQLDEELALMRDRGPGSVPNPNGPANPILRTFYWVGSLALGIAILIALAWRFRIRINMPPFPVILEASMMRVGMRPPERLRLWARRAALPPLSKAYLEINNSLRRLGRQPGISETPNERVESLSQVLPPAKAPAHRLVEEYQADNFSSTPGMADLPAARDASRKIRFLSYKAYLRSLFVRLQRPKRPSFTR